MSVTCFDFTYLSQSKIEFTKRSCPIDILTDRGSIMFPEELWASAKYKNWGKGFWADTRLRIIHTGLKARGLNSILDIGSGDGALVSIPLAEKGIAVTCVEPSSSGASRTRAAGLTTHNCSLEFATSILQPVSAVGAFDVIEYFRDSQDFLGLIRRLLLPGGLLFMTVPAHPWLFSDYDLAVGNLARFSRTTLIDELQSAGFSIETFHGMFSFLIPFAILNRRLPYLLGLRRSRDYFASQAAVVRRIPPAVEDFLAEIVNFEARISFPSGLSWFVIARREGQRE